MAMFRRGEIQHVGGKLEKGRKKRPHCMLVDLMSRSTNIEMDEFTNNAHPFAQTILTIWAQFHRAA